MALKVIDPPLENFEGDKRARLQQLMAKWQTCQRCQLGQIRSTSRIPEIVFGDGNPDAPIVVVGEAPGEEEEKTFVPFVGASGKLLNTILATATDDPEIRQLHQWYVGGPTRGAEAATYENTFHTKMFEWRQQNFFITNAVGCRPPENGKPSNPDIQTCWERVWNIIYIVDPVLVVTCGNSGLVSVSRKTQLKVTAARGNIADVSFQGRMGEVTYPLLPTFHPSYLLRKADWNIKNGDYDKTVQDWKNALAAVKFLTR